VLNSVGGAPIGVVLTFTGTGSISDLTFITTSDDSTGAYSVTSPMAPGVYAVTAQDSGTLAQRAVEVPPTGQNLLTITAGQTANQTLVIVVPPSP